ncbi:transposase domain-containing protein [Actinacidiphila yeochonensis]|uniref:transposase domain-containing protein n=1 Tax=Actinacidiphila yeochonensis TaxID=89050 RepID=UPI000689E656|nr:transposase domain-containing protein [Actinacidiphila yeochonensis]
MSTTEQRLADRLAVGMLTWTYPLEAVENAITAAGRCGQRNRLLPPHLVVYFVLAMCMFPAARYEEVAELLAEGIRLTAPAGLSTLRSVPSTAAVSRARMRLGATPLETLFAQVATVRSVTPGAPPERLEDLRVRVLGGRVSALPESPENAAVYGAASPGGRPSGPRLRISVLADNASGALLGARLDPVYAGVGDVAGSLLGRVGPGDLVVADADYGRPRLWRTAARTGADLLWSVPDGVVLPPARPLSDGSALTLLPARPDPASGRAELATVRVLNARPGGGKQLLTTLLDPRQAPAPALRAVYADRWSFEAASQRLADRGKRELRSRSPEMVRQEIWGHLLVYSAIQRLSNDPRA